MSACRGAGSGPDFAATFVLEAFFASHTAHQLESRVLIAGEDISLYGIENILDCINMCRELALAEGPEVVQTLRPLLS